MNDDKTPNVNVGTPGHCDHGSSKSAVERVVSGWNKTSEVLPDAIGSYLIVKDSDEGREIEWAFFNSNKQWCATTGYFIDDDVTHWRRLPALPGR